MTLPALSRPPLTHPPRFLHAGKMEPDKLPYSGTPHPLALRYFYARIPSGALQFLARVLCREGAEISPSRVNTVRRLYAVISLPAPHTLGAFQSDKRIGGHHGC